MNIDHYNEVISVMSRKIERFSFWQGVGFLILALEGAAKDFYCFQSDTKTSGGADIKLCISAAWSVLERGGSWPGFAPNIEFLDEITPDTEKFSSKYTSLALDTVGIVELLISYLPSGDLGYIKSCSKTMFDSAFLRQDMGLAKFDALDIEAIDHEFCRQAALCEAISSVGEERVDIYFECIALHVRCA